MNDKAAFHLPYAFLIDKELRAVRVFREADGEKKMKRFSLFASVIAFGIGTVSVFSANHYPISPRVNDISQTTDAAFRDGLYLGRLAAERHIVPHVVSGRWATEADRASFTEGYQRGYAEFLASRVAR